MEDPKDKYKIYGLLSCEFKHFVLKVKIQEYNLEIDTNLILNTTPTSISCKMGTFKYEDDNILLGIIMNDAKLQEWGCNIKCEWVSDIVYMGKLCYKVLNKLYKGIAFTYKFVTSFLVVKLAIGAIVLVLFISFFILKYIGIFYIIKKLYHIFIKFIKYLYNYEILKYTIYKPAKFMYRIGVPKYLIYKPLKFGIKTTYKTTKLGIRCIKYIFGIISSCKTMFTNIFMSIIHRFGFLF